MKRKTKGLALMLTLTLLISSVAAYESDGDLHTTPAPPVNNAPPPQWWNPNDSNSDFLGNADLIDSQNIVFESNVISFITVTTRAGNVFYVLIDHRIPDGEANVYFLTQVNEFDLLMLLYTPSQDEDAPPPPVHPAQTTPTGSQNRPSTQDESDDEHTEGESAQTPLIPPIVLGLFGVIVLGLIGLGIYALTAKKKNNPRSPIRDDYDDDDDSYEYEELDRTEIDD